MKFPAWIRHGLTLAALYWGFSVLTGTVIGVVFKKDIAHLANTTARDIAHVLSALPDDQLRKTFEEIRERRFREVTLMGNFWIVDEGGAVLASTTRVPLPDYWNSQPLPTQLLEARSYDLEPRSPRARSIVRFKENPTRYLITAEMPDAPAHLSPPTVWNQVMRGFLYFFIWFVLSVAFLSTLTVLYVFRIKAAQARKVMEAIEGGKLQERFSVSRIDEMGGLMAKFNTMASTIETLVGRLRRADSSRKAMLQELNHDLRTPLTSLNLMVETLGEHRGKLSASKQAEYFQDMKTELDYINRLVRFLFTLPDMDEATYRVDFKREDFGTMVREEIERRQTLSFPGRGPLKWTLDDQTSGAAPLRGDRSLLNRLLRNALDNAAKFCAERVHCVLSETSTHWQLDILDDGPGPTPEALARFGKRPQSTEGMEVLHPEKGVGLGSSIMAAISELHDGTLTFHRASAPWGARLSLSLPKAETARAAA